MPHPPLIVPRVGGGQEKQVRGTAEAMDKAARIIARIKPETIVLSTPHSVMYGDYIHISPGESASGDFGAFGAPDVSFGKTYDTEFVSALSGLAFERDISAGALGERDKRLDHATLVPLYFVDKYYTDYKLVRVSISGLPLAAHYSFGRCVSDAAESLNRRTVFIASGDLSHKLSQSGPYGFDKRGPEFDLKVTKAMKTADFSRFFSFTEHFCEAAAECGLRGFTQMAGALWKLHFIHMKGLSEWVTPYAGLSPRARTRTAVSAKYTIRINRQSLSGLKKAKTIMCVSRANR